MAQNGGPRTYSDKKFRYSSVPIPEAFAYYVPQSTQLSMEGNLMKRSLAILLVAGAFAIGAQAFAHHSFAATYLEDQETSIEGDLVQFLYRNPHSFVHVMAPEPQTKEMVRWAVEWGGGGQLGQQGVTRETLKPGDHVVITGSPGRNPADHRLRMRTIFRAKDGWRWGGVVD